jgi:hypothetical protein
MPAVRQEKEKMKLNSITENMNKIVAQLTRLQRPVVKLLQPGLSLDEIAQYEKKLSFKLTPELILLYQLKNGTTAPENTPLEDMWFFPGFYFLSLGEAADVCLRRQRSRQWKKDGFPVFADGGGDFYVVSCDAKSPAGVIGFMHGEPEQEVEYQSLAAMFETIAECLIEGAFFVKNDDFEIDDAKHEQIAAKLNPNVAFWIKAAQEKEDKNKREEAKQQAEVAYQLLQKGEIAQALVILEKVINVPDLPNWVYVNALYAANPQHHKGPLEQPRIRRILEISLPYAKYEPNIFLNAAFISVALGESDNCLEYFKKAQSRGADLSSYLSDPGLAVLENDKRFIRLKKICENKKKA